MAITRTDWTLLAIDAADGAALSPVQLQKALFILGAEMPQSLGEGFYEFRPYNYGPFTGEIYTDAEQLADQGLVRITRHRWNEYSITPEGQSQAVLCRKRADSHATEYLKRVVAWARTLSFEDLLRSVYARYPKMREKSIFEDRGA